MKMSETISLNMKVCTLASSPDCFSYTIYTRQNSMQNNSISVTSGTEKTYKSIKRRMDAGIRTNFSFVFSFHCLLSDVFYMLKAKPVGRTWSPKISTK